MKADVHHHSESMGFTTLGFEAIWILAAILAAAD